MTLSDTHSQSDTRHSDAGVTVGYASAATAIGGDGALHTLTKYRDRDSFMAGFRVDPEGLFLAARSQRPVGACVPFTVRLNDRTVMLEGRGEVLSAIGRGGERAVLRLRFVELTPASRALIASMVHADRGAPASTPAPDDGSARALPAAPDPSGPAEPPTGTAAEAPSAARSVPTLISATGEEPPAQEASALTLDDADLILEAPTAPPPGAAAALSLEPESEDEDRGRRAGGTFIGPAPAPQPIAPPPGVMPPDHEWAEALRSSAQVLGGRAIHRSEPATPPAAPLAPLPRTPSLRSAIGASLIPVDPRREAADREPAHAVRSPSVAVGPTYRSPTGVSAVPPRRGPGRSLRLGIAAALGISAAVAVQPFLRDRPGSPSAWLAGLVARARTFRAARPAAVAPPERTAAAIPRRAEPAAVSAPARCRLEVHSEPEGAAVLVNGRFRGLTPAEIEGLRCEGEAWVELIHHGYEPWAEPATPRLRGAEPLEVQLAKLVPLIALRSRPEGAEVTVDGVPAGRTPLDLRVPADTIHRIGLSLPGYRPWSDVVAADRALITVDPELAPQPGRPHPHGTPPAAGHHASTGPSQHRRRAALASLAARVDATPAAAPSADLLPPSAPADLAP